MNILVSAVPPINLHFTATENLAIRQFLSQFSACVHFLSSYPAFIAAVKDVALNLED